MANQPRLEGGDLPYLVFIVILVTILFKAVFWLHKRIRKVIKEIKRKRREKVQIRTAILLYGSNEQISELFK